MMVFRESPFQGSILRGELLVSGVYTLPKTNIASKNDGFQGISFSGVYFQGRTVSFRKGSSYEIQASAQTEMDTSCIYEMNFIEIL